MLTPDTIARHRAALEARLARLDGRVHQIEAELESHIDRDWEEMAVLREGDEVLERQGTAAQTEMAAIRAALGRLAVGTYGDCVSCGAPIAPARLDILPEAALCARCAAPRAK